MSEITAIGAGHNSAGCAASADARRAKQRFPVNAIFQVVPLDRDRKLVPSAGFAAVGKDLSTTGLAVSHGEPIRHSRVVIITAPASEGQFCIEAEVAWTRALPEGSHESGLRFIRKLS